MLTDVNQINFIILLSLLFVTLVTTAELYHCTSFDISSLFAELSVLQSKLSPVAKSSFFISLPFVHHCQPQRSCLTADTYQSCTVLLCRLQLTCCKFSDFTLVNTDKVVLPANSTLHKNRGEKKSNF